MLLFKFQNQFLTFNRKEITPFKAAVRTLLNLSGLHVIDTYWYHISKTPFEKIGKLGLNRHNKYTKYFKQL